jgi:chaperonin GroES
MTLRPLHDRVVLRRVPPSVKSAGGILIPDTVQEKPVEGEVVAVGLGARDAQGIVHAPGVKPGDHVLFGKWSGNEFTLDGEDLLVINTADIFGVVDQAAAQKHAA